RCPPPGSSRSRANKRLADASWRGARCFDRGSSGKDIEDKQSFWSLRDSMWPANSRLATSTKLHVRDRNEVGGALLRQFLVRENSATPPAIARPNEWWRPDCSHAHDTKNGRRTRPLRSSKERRQ